MNVGKMSVHRKAQIGNAEYQKYKQLYDRILHFVPILDGITMRISEYLLSKTFNSLYYTIMIVAMCAVIKAYTPPEAPAKKMRGDVIDVPIEPAATPAK